MSEGTYQRARSAQKKQERADAFLAAARTVALRDGVHETTLVAIADEVGLHHSAIRRYFASRDAVLLRLATGGWQAWAERIRSRLEARVVDTDVLAEVLVETLIVDRLFCDLLGNVPLRLERSVDEEDLLSFKRSSMDSLGQIVGTISSACPEIGRKGSRDLMTAANALAATLWQVCHPSPELDAIYQREPDLGHGESDFAPLLHRVLAATAKGLRGGSAK